MGYRLLEVVFVFWIRIGFAELDKGYVVVQKEARVITFLLNLEYILAWNI